MVAAITDMARWTKGITVLVKWVPVMLLVVILACRQEAPLPVQTPSLPTAAVAKETPSVPTPTPLEARDEEGKPVTAKGMYETCPAFETESLPTMLRDEVTLHPELVKDTIEAIKRELRDPYTIQLLGIEEAGEAMQVTVADTGEGDRMTGPRHQLGDGRELYNNFHLWGWATFEGGSEISFHVWAAPVPSGQDCEIQGVAIKPSSFVPG